ncbi:LUD domain-containing protein [Microtetraspora sp. NBRC 16547]|uniref:LutC/YkgG family protein n=1 Tax=Microtetraspora sp. NBRC 16547 TaxID=3030993 RepID=UPI0024A0873C|nr:LUD domain-containing protein [Microtetraspora sp. NBRC 16547]GLX00893.1 hypothetical protein Misp02_49790 [Microtetraspora sp. NBRC 16547]
MNSRDMILARVRGAVAGAPDVEVPRAYRGAAGVTAGVTPRDTGGDTGPNADERLIDLFAERLRDYRAIVHVVAEAEVASVVAEALGRREIRRLVVPEGLPAAWLDRGPYDTVGDDPELSAADLDGTDGVITGCAVAIAETGTIVLDAGPGQGRRALTLLPDYHLCVVRAGQLVSGVPDAVARLAPERPLTWISGPSATSDIELNRVEGVHGPRTLEVVIST